MSMQNDDETVGTILTRREAFLIAARSGLTLAALGGARGLAIAEPLQTQKVHLVASPMLTEGPFFVDEKLNRSDLVSGTDRASVKNGIPLQLGFTVLKLNGDSHAPLKDAHVDVWHADAIGVYSDENQPMNHELTGNQKWLRGYQVADADGNTTFKTIFPGWYPGRTQHIHFKIRTYSSADKVTAEFTSQVFFREADVTAVYAKEPYTRGGRRDTSNLNDGVYNERQHDGTMAGDHMLLDLKKGSDGKSYSANFTVVLTDGTLHASQGRGPGRRGGPGGPPPGPPPGGFGGPPPGGPF